MYLEYDLGLALLIIPTNTDNIIVSLVIQCTRDYYKIIKHNRTEKLVVRNMYIVYTKKMKDQRARYFFISVINDINNQNHVLTYFSPFYSVVR